MSSIPIEKQLQKVWYEFRTYAKENMGYTDKQNLNECLNGAGAFVDFLCGGFGGRFSNTTSLVPW